jgi:hypothetical protein
MDSSLHTPKTQNSDLILISKMPSIVKRFRSVEEEFQLSFAKFDDVELLNSSESQSKAAKCFVIDCIEEKPGTIAGIVQSAKYFSNSAYIVVVVGSKIDTDSLDIIKKSGASAIILDADYFDSSRIEFILSQVLKTAYVPIKVSDLVADSVLECPLFYILPVNQKFIKFYNPGNNIDAKFIEKYLPTNEIYIRREDINRWSEYLKTFPASDENVDIRGGRAKFLKLHYSFIDLALMITDQSTAATFAKGNEQLKEIVGFVDELSETIKIFKDPWGFINNSSVGDFGSVERGAAVAAYANLIASRLGIKNPKEVMISALLADVGCLLLSPGTNRKVRNEGVESLSKEELAEYSKHPSYSLNQCLSRKLQLSENIKKNILQSHERMDRSGFPNRPAPEKITMQAMIVKLAAELDLFMQVRMGKAAKKSTDIKTVFIPKVINDAASYPVLLRTALQEIF